MCAERHSPSPLRSSRPGLFLSAGTDPLVECSLMPRNSSPYPPHAMRNLLRRRGLRLEWLEDRVVPSGLTLSLANSSVTEGLGTSATVTRTGDLSQPLTVQLTSSDTTEATLPASVVISAGQASATVAVQAVDDTLFDGTQQATLTAQATAPPTFAQVSG